MTTPENHISLCVTLNLFQGLDEFSDKLLENRRAMKKSDVVKPVVPATLLFLFISCCIAKPPIVFHSSYIFDSNVEYYIECNLKKYQEVYGYLRNTAGLKEDDFYCPQNKISDKDLSKIHDQDYLHSLMYTKSIVDVLNNSGFQVHWALGWAFNSTLQTYFLDPCRYAVAGTVLATQLALQKGWAINLSGGYHRAYSGKGDMLCFFNDIAMAIYTLRRDKTNRDLKVLVVNLDFHAGTGLAQICKNDKNTYMFDSYAEKISDKDKDLFREGYDFTHKLYHGIEDRAYINELTRELLLVIKKVKPGLIIYNAGTDIYKKDPLNKGEAKISQEGIVLRDEIVFKLAKKNKIPIAMLLSGGLSDDTGSIICASLANLIEKKLISLQ